MRDNGRAYDRASYDRVPAMLVALALEHSREYHEGERHAAPTAGCDSSGTESTPASCAVCRDRSGGGERGMPFPARAWRVRAPATCLAVEDGVRDGKLIVVVNADQVGLLFLVAVPWLFRVGGLLRLGCVRG